MTDEVEGWSIINGLGTGRFSRVYEVKRNGNQDSSSFVLKFLTDENREMGRHEARILRDLQQAEGENENVPKVYNSIDNGRYYALVVSPVGIPIILASQSNIITSVMIVTLLDVLSFAHEKLYLIHRDVKPENIFLNKNNPNQIILSDWGSAAQEGLPCPYQGTPIYGPRENRRQLQIPTKHLDLHCLVKTVYMIKQQRYPPSESEWPEIERYWSRVARMFPNFRSILNLADEGNSAGLRSYFEGMWY
jgi:serine/threonine protein kinase